MSPIVILVRHAEALHNEKHDFSLHDPGLTDKGKSQCKELAEFLRTKVPLAHEAGLIVTSPMKRTLETTQISLGWLIEEGVPVMLQAEWQETTDKPCDTGVPVPVAEAEWPGFDFSTVDALYPTKEGPYAYSQDALMERIGKCLSWLQHRPEKVILVVSHSGFMRRLSGRRFGNADFRIFEFTKDNQFRERPGAQVTGGRGLSPGDPSRAKEHWAGIKKSSSTTNITTKAMLSIHSDGWLTIPDVPLRPSSR